MHTSLKLSYNIDNVMKTHETQHRSVICQTTEVTYEVKALIQQAWYA